MGDQFTIQTSIYDPTLVEPFVTLIRLTVVKKQKHPSKPTVRKKKHGTGGGDAGNSLGIRLPNVITVRSDDEHWNRHDFTPKTACHVQTDPRTIDGKDVEEHTFYINVHNTALRTEMKYSRQDARVLEGEV